MSGLLKYLGLFSASILGASAVADGPLHTSGRWVVDSNQDRFKMKCVNWAGHMEVNIPEGLQHQPVDNIAQWIADQGFNCVRLTYSIDMALSPNTTVKDSFTAAADETGVSAEDMQDLYDSVVENNDFVSSGTLLSTYSAVIEALAAKDIKVVLDNHVSKASWCCNYEDGNGWWASAFGYIDANSRYFDTDDWLQGLSAMSTYSNLHSNVIGMSLRNELRALLLQDTNNHDDWYDLVGQGSTKIHAGNPNLLIVVGGTWSATTIDFIRNRPLDTSGWPNKTVIEFHDYQWDHPIMTCDMAKALIGGQAGFVLQQNEEYTAPLWLSEFGMAVNTPSDDEVNYMSCLVDYMSGNDADWAIWAIQGSYYVRDGEVNHDESFGLMNPDFSGARNQSFIDLLGDMWDTTQGP